MRAGALLPAGMLVLAQGHMGWNLSSQASTAQRAAQGTAVPARHSEAFNSLVAAIRIWPLHIKGVAPWQHDVLDIGQARVALDLL